MNDAVRLFPKFLVVCSIILIIAGVSQIFVRPRKENETPVERFVNRATITALVTLSFGIAGLLFGLGVLKLPRF